MFGFWQVLLADLQQALRLSPGALGSALTAGFVASFPAMLVGGRAADRWGARSLIAMTGLMMSIALLGVVVVHNYWPLIGLLFLFFGATGAFDVGINAAAICVEQVRHQRVISYGHPYTVPVFRSIEAAAAWCFIAL